MPLTGVWIQDKTVHPRDASGHKLKKTFRYVHVNFDGVTIDPAECTCTPFFATDSGEWNWLEECPIDDHKVFARKQRAAELDEELTVGTLARQRFERASAKGRTREENHAPIAVKQGHKKCAGARVLRMPLHRDSALQARRRNHV